MNNTEYLLDDILKAISFHTRTMVECTELICEKLENIEGFCWEELEREAIDEISKKANG